jgi:hypothetical protein
MYQTIREYQTDKNSVAEILTEVEKSFVSLVSNAQGFREYTIIDAGNGVIVSNSLFANRSDGDAFNTQASKWVNEHLSHLALTPPKVMSGEVRSHVTGTVLAS